MRLSAAVLLSWGPPAATTPVVAAAQGDPGKVGPVTLGNHRTGAAAGR